ncbi:hypothetical protein HXX76_010429 [Chlamydomonas incerta]|uniref:Uncharacterized protein n=1 Tax=Chlamydomonas incerta TaxID=51695 RepID=A0A835VWN6_CHLIN|nr:hypothetical protein HXX76_010429 [Chlamydomonas incerta]|eukprot:KAG2428279.1 hypothetical protein HXX76_010429 [Chlamydomonas incerta]
MYSRYREGYYWWDSVLMLQTIALVAVDVFGKGLVVEWQALMLTAVLVATSVFNSIVQAVPSDLLRHLEAASSAILVLTITLNLYFVTGTGEELVDQAGGTVIAVLVLVLNLGLIAVFAVYIGRASFDGVKEMAAAALASAATAAAVAAAGVARRFCMGLTQTAASATAATGSCGGSPSVRGNSSGGGGGDGAA